MRRLPAMTNKLRVPVFCMALTIVIITAFQVYWLHQHYREEKRLFSVRTNMLFRETIVRLQASRLHLDSNINIRVQDKEGIVKMTSLLHEKFQDSTNAKHHLQTAMVITLDHADRSTQPDSNMHYQFGRQVTGSPVFEFLRGVDSLQDSISVKEITSVYAAALAKEKIHLPFIITTVDAVARGTQPLPDMEDNRAAIGFINPRIYQLDFLNNSWYIFRHMWQQVLVSFLLVSITIASFMLLYRNLVRQQKLTEFKNNFISNITHELKTPIATVSVAIEALKNFNALQDPQRTQEYLDISASEMQRLGLLVDKVLKLSLYEKKQITLNRERFSLVALADEVVSSMKLQLDKQQAVATVQTTGQHFVIEADRLHLASVLYNLLDNALKYSSDKPVIGIHIIDHSTYIELTVSDNGIGIAPEYRYKIFEQFFRVPGGDRHNTKGYGLGLSYVNHIVHSHMGFIEMKSTLGKGSCFSVNLPFAEAPVIEYGNGRKIINKSFKIGGA